MAFCGQIHFWIGFSSPRLEFQNAWGIIWDCTYWYLNSSMRSLFLWAVAVVGLDIAGEVSKFSLTAFYCPGFVGMQQMKVYLLHWGKGQQSEADCSSVAFLWAPFTRRKSGFIDTSFRYKWELHGAWSRTLDPDSLLLSWHPQSCTGRDQHLNPANTWGNKTLFFLSGERLALLITFFTCGLHYRAKILHLDLVKNNLERRTAHHIMCFMVKLLPPLGLYSSLWGYLWIVTDNCSRSFQ